MQINEIFTVTEAAQLWELNESTVKKACQQGRFSVYEARKSKSAWMVTKVGMERVYGKQKRPTIS